jgi:phosphopantothenoylcysteine decarboxylase/phosphopantothenate--cysteine ligase
VVHPATKNNLEKIAAHGSFIIPVESGDLASGLTGEGRMAEPEAIIGWLNEFFQTGDN